MFDTNETFKNKKSTILTRVAVSGAAETHVDLPKRSVIHVHYPFPNHAPSINLWCFLEVYVVVNLK